MPPLTENLQGRDYWRGLEELADSPQIRGLVEEEFPGYDPEDLPSESRRGFLKLMAASMAMAGLTLPGCRRWPKDEVRPHAYRQEGVKPGMAMHFATMSEMAGVSTGLLVRSYEGRPIKIEGNREHPYALGAADGFLQASILTMYDPERSRAPYRVIGGKPQRQDWTKFKDFAGEHFGQLKAGRGAGLAVVSEYSSSPTHARMRKAFEAAYPEAMWVEYEPIDRDQEIEGARKAFGQPVRPIYRLNEARVIACFDADPLGQHPAHQRHAADWARGRRSAEAGWMNRLYAVESAFTATGSVADDRLPIKASRVASLLQATAAGLGVGSTSAPALEAAEQAYVDRLVTDLREAPGQSVVMVGANQPADLHVLAHAINESLHNFDRTVSFIAESQAATGSRLMTQLAKEIKGGAIKSVVILGGNPVYDAPADIDFAGALAAAGEVIHLSDYVNETSKAATWHLNRAHYLECWGDGQAWDGTVSLQQPLILPLYDGKSPIELLAMLAGHPIEAGYDLVRETHRNAFGAGFEKAWRVALHDGVVRDSEAVEIEVATRSIPALKIDDAAGAAGSFEVTFRADRSTYDGRFANNGWLQEVPDSLTKLVWDNAALLSKHDADAMHVGNGDLIRIEKGGRSLEIVVYIMPGQPRGSIALPLGYGRTSAGAVGDGVGFDTYTLRTSDALSFSGGWTVTRTGETYPLSMTQLHHLVGPVLKWGRETRVGEGGKSGMLVKESTLEGYKADPKFVDRGIHGDLSLQLFSPPNPNFHDWPEKSHADAPEVFNSPHAWGMSVDMSSCTGCNACVISCQSENNIPIVGKKQVGNHREMHWLRIDRYFKGEVENPDVVYQPLACVQCENAPCEQVCPVAATVHDSEGLNTMVYNRCIGTRYCSNNCPYKVRRFNYFDYQSKPPTDKAAMPFFGIPDQQQREQVDKIKAMVFNPEVTVRMRGVMEKCTYCVQRIQEAKSTARIEYMEGRREEELVHDGEILTACQSACPTQAIVFGNLNDADAKVSQQQKLPRSYAMLRELNTRPRTMYLAKLRNPSPAKAGSADVDGSDDLH